MAAFRLNCCGVMGAYQYGGMFRAGKMEALKAISRLSSMARLFRKTGSPGIEFRSAAWHRTQAQISWQASFLDRPFQYPWRRYWLWQAQELLRSTAGGWQ